MSQQIVEQLVPDLTARIHTIGVRERVPGLAVGIVRDQELAWFGGFGRVDLKTGRGPGRETLFRVASITKTFTATAILQLRDEGRLSLDDPLHKHIPEFSKARVRAGTLDGVTLRRLMSHHSGLTTEAPLPCWDSLAFPSREEMLAALAQTEIVIPQDSAFKYSNLAFGLLGEVVARVSGISYGDYLQTRILEPLGMRSSRLELTDRERPQLAIGYYPRTWADGFDVAPYVSLNGISACGQLHTSVDDLARWVSLQFRTGDVARGGAQVLAGRSLAEMHRPQYLEADWSIAYCLGWRATRTGDHVYHGHGGGIHGFASYVLFSKPFKLGVICLANVWPHPGLLPTATEIAEKLLQAGWTVPKAPESAAQPMPAAWGNYLGLYKTSSGVFAAVIYRDGALRLEKTPLSDYVLHAPARLEATDGPGTFVVRGGRAAGERLTFQTADKGAASFALGGFVYRKLTATLP